MDEALMDKGMNTPWQLTILEAAIFLENAGAESMKIKMKTKNGQTRQVVVSVIEPDSQE